MKTQDRAHSLETHAPPSKHRTFTPSAARCLCLHAASSLLLSGTVGAQLQVFDNRMDFEAAAANADQDLLTEDFEAFTTDLPLDGVPTSIANGAVMTSTVSRPGWIKFGVDASPTRFGDHGIDSPSIVGNFLLGGSYSTDMGEIRFDLAPKQGRIPMIGFDYSGVTGGPSIANKIMGYRITYRDGSIVEGPLPDRESDSDGRPDDDGFVGFCDLKNPIQSLVIVDINPLPHPDPPDGGEVYAIDNVTVSVTTPLLITSLQFDKSQDGVSITWTSTSGKSYFVERSSNFVDWYEIADSIEDTDGVTSYLDTEALVSSGTAFYRVSEQSQ